VNLDRLCHFHQWGCLKCNGHGLLVPYVKWPLNGTFATSPLLLGYKTYDYQNRGHGHFPHVFGAHMNISFIIKVKIFVLIKWSYRSPRFYWLLSLEWLSYSEHRVQSLETHVFLGFAFGVTSNHTLLEYRCPNKKSKQIMVVHLITDTSNSICIFECLMGLWIILSG
jgi:hypothetical protein